MLDTVNPATTTSASTRPDPAARRGGSWWSRLRPRRGGLRRGDRPAQVGTCAPGPVGLRLARHRATTAHTASLYPCHAEAGPGPRGAYLGQNVLTGGGAFHFDPFQAYTDGLVTSPNMVIFGAVGAGKSSSVKTFLHRTVGLLGSPGGLGRWCAVIDPKGEYRPLADALGIPVVKLYPGGTTRLNPLDPGPNSAAVSGVDLAQRRGSMAAAMTAAVLGRPLRQIEDAVIGWAAEAVARSVEPTLADLAHLIAAPTVEMGDRARKTPEELAGATEDVGFALGKLLDRDLRGMFDGPSTVNIDWTGRGLVLDLSAVYHDADALRLVMIAAAGWLQAYLATPMGVDVPRRVQVIEEAWAVLGDPMTARYLQGCYKLSRQFGVANIAVAHRISDLRAQADDGTSAQKIAMALLADTETRVMFRQGPDQVAEAVSLLGLTDTEASILPALPRGRSLWKVGARSAVCQHVIGAHERALCDTDTNLSLT